MTFDEWYPTQPQLTNEPVCRAIWDAATKAAIEKHARVAEGLALVMDETGQVRLGDVDCIAACIRAQGTRVGEVAVAPVMAPIDIPLPPDAIAALKEVAEIAGTPLETVVRVAVGRFLAAAAKQKDQSNG